MRTFWLIVLTCAALPRIVVGSDENSNDKEKIQGTWSIISFEGDGEVVPAEKLRGRVVVITATKFTFGKEEAEYKIDPSMKPRRHFDLQEDKEKKRRTAPGIYLLEGDDLTLCWDSMQTLRPANFSSKGEPRTDRRLLVLKREKKP